MQDIFKSYLVTVVFCSAYLHPGNIRGQISPQGFCKKKLLPDSMGLFIVHSNLELVRILSWGMGIYCILRGNLFFLYTNPFSVIILLCTIGPEELSNTLFIDEISKRLSILALFLHG